MLQLCDFGCERDERQLFAGLNLTINTGDIVQVHGANGCGKTTLLRVLTTSSSEYSGEILYQGKPLSKNRLNFLNDLLYIGHNPGVKKALTPRENLAWYIGMSNGRQRTVIDQALLEVGLYGFEDVPCFSLSAGQLRRVALARLYLSTAQLWILDEPFTAIDKQGVSNLEKRMADHVAGGGSLIITTHQELGLSGVKRVDLLNFKEGGK